MAEQHPYTHIYTDAAGRSLSVEVDAGQPLIIAAEGEESTFIYAPTGEEAVRLVRGILALAGDTGHVVVSEESIRRETYDAEENGRANGADSMRARVLHVISQSENRAHLLAKAIRALPLDPDDDAHESPEYLAEELDAERARNKALQQLLTDAEVEITALHQERGRPRVAWASSRRTPRPEGDEDFNRGPRCGCGPKPKTVEERVAALEELTDLLADIVESHSRALEPAQKQPPADS